MAATRIPSTTSLTTVTAGSTEPFGEKNIDSTTIEPNSATEHAATTKVPARVSSTPASLSTGTMIPSDVDERTMATNNGSTTTSSAPSGSANASPTRSDATKLTSPSRSGRPRSLAKSSSRPARNSSNATPSWANTLITESSLTQSRTAGPMRIPAAISTTDDGIGTRGTRPRRSGTATATTMTRRMSSKLTSLTRSNVP